MRGETTSEGVEKGLGGGVVAGGYLHGCCCHSNRHQETAGWECGRLCEGQGSGVPSSLVWVSVPPSGSASSKAPGSLKGLSLQEEEKSKGTHGPFSQCKREQRQEDTFTAAQSQRTFMQQ